MIFFKAALFFLLSASAQANVRVWILAPELSSQQAVEAAKASIEIEKILNSSGNIKFDIEIKNVEAGRAVSWSIKSKEWKLNEMPDFIFYYLPGRNIAREFEEATLASWSDDSGILSSGYVTSYCDKSPSFVKYLTTEEVCNRVGRAIAMKENFQSLRIDSFEKPKEDIYLSISFRGIQRLFLDLYNKSSRRTVGILLISPEHIEYYSDIFDQRNIADSMALLAVPELSISRLHFKERLEGSLVDIPYYILLPSTFYSLYQAENLISGSRRILNEVGVKQWSDLMGRFLVGYFKQTAAVYKLEERNKFEPTKPAPTPKSPTKKKR